MNGGRGVQDLATQSSNFIQSNWMTIIFGIISIISLIYAFFSYRVKKPYWDRKSVTIIKEETFNKYKRLELLYDKQPIKNFTVSNVVFYNRGREPIRENDVSTPFSICIDDGYLILDYKVIYPKEYDQYNVGRNDTGNCICINFKYMEQNDGIVLQILHSGKSGRNINVKGKIIGSKITRRFGSYKLGATGSSSRLKRSRQLENVLMVIYIMFIIGMSLSLFIVRPSSTIDVITPIGMIIIMIGALWIMVLSRVPRDLEIFEIFEEEF